MRTRTCYRLRDVSWLVLLRSGTQSSPVSAKRCGLELPTRFYGRVRDDSFRIRPVGMRTMACICGKVTERDEEKVLEVCLRPRSLIWVFLTVFCLFTALFAFSLFAGLIARSWGVVLASAATLAAMVLLYRFFAKSEVRSLAAYYKPIFKSYGLEEITP